MKYSIFYGIVCCFILNTLSGQAITFEVENPFLYRNCVNELRIVSPQIATAPENYWLEVSGYDTLLTDKDDRQRLLIIPHNYSVTLKLCRIGQDGKTIKSFIKIKVLEPPGVSYVFEVDGKRTERPNIDKNTKITFKILPDSDFAERMPEETDYRIDSLKIYLQPSDTQPPFMIKKMGFSIDKPQTEKVIALPDECFVYGKGSKILINAGETYRLNAAGQLIYIPFRGTLYDRVQLLEVK